MVGSSAPLVSVVIPTYFRNDTLLEAVRSASNQSYEPVEIIVVDDSGEGHAREVVPDRPDVTYVQLDRNRGSNRARSIGAGRADGAYVNFLDDDDRMFEQKLERQVTVAEENDDVGVVYCGIEKTGGNVNLPDPGARGDVLDRALMFDLWPCMTSTMLIDSGVLSRILPLSVRPGGDDLEMMIQLARLTSFDYVDEPLLFKRLDAASRGFSKDAVEGRFEIIEDYEEVYQSFPPSVRNRALALVYEDRARVEFMDKTWSADAIASLAKHYYYSSWTDPKALAKLTASLFGSPGWRLIRYIGQSSA